MPIRRSPNDVLNAVHRLGRLPGTVGRHPVGTVGRHASERQVVMTWCAHLRSLSWRECSTTWLVSGTGEDETPRRPKTRDVSGHSGRRPIRLAGRAYRKRVYEMGKV